MDLCRDLGYILLKMMGAGFLQPPFELNKNNLTQAAGTWDAGLKATRVTGHTTAA